MPQKNVELALDTFEAIGRRDLAKLLRLTSPEVEWQSFFTVGVGGKYLGHEGIRRYVEDLDEAWEAISPATDDLLSVGDLVLLVGSLSYCGKGSGIEAKSPAGWVLKMREGRVASFRAFRDPEQVLEAVGLSE